MYVDPITRQTYDFATPIACDNNPRNIIELEPNFDDQDFHILGPEPLKRKPQYTPKYFYSTRCWLLFNAELDQFWKRILFSKQSDSALLGKALSYSFISSNTPDYDANSPLENPYNIHELVYMTNF